MIQTTEERSVLRKADLLSKLPKMEAFQVLQEAIERKQQRMEKELMTLVLAEGMDAEDIKLKAERFHGYVAGMRYAVVDVPAGAVRTLAQREPGKEPDEGVQDHWA
jgi:hypothetical protein